ncbi:transposase [Streptomyces sp. So13.3]|nr:transposase [Streptomyces sp. So13.3]
MHGRYLRRLSDAAISGTRVVIELLIRRFRCLNAACAAVTFAEQVTGLTSPHARYTPLMRGTLTSIALALAGRGRRPTRGRAGGPGGEGHPVTPAQGLPRGACRAGQGAGRRRFRATEGDSYATVLVDLERRRPVDVLPGREAEPLAAWLRDHPRGGGDLPGPGGSYAEGARANALKRCR